MCLTLDLEGKLALFVVDIDERMEISIQIFPAISLQFSLTLVLGYVSIYLQCHLPLAIRPRFFCSSSVHIGLCLQMGSVVDFPQFDQFTIFLFLQFIFLGSGTWINRPPSRAERRASFPIWCEFGAYWEALPWEVFDAFHEGLFECVAPYVVDDEVGGGVDDEAEVVDAGQTELPGCGAWLLTNHLLPENDKKGKVFQPPVFLLTLHSSQLWGTRQNWELLAECCWRGRRRRCKLGSSQGSPF